jgi:hypothetical protein
MILDYFVKEYIGHKSGFGYSMHIKDNVVKLT